MDVIRVVEDRHDRRERHRGEEHRLPERLSALAAHAGERRADDADGGERRCHGEDGRKGVAGVPRKEPDAAPARLIEARVVEQRMDDERLHHCPGAGAVHEERDEGNDHQEEGAGEGGDPPGRPVAAENEDTLGQEKRRGTGRYRDTLLLLHRDQQPGRQTGEESVPGVRTPEEDDDEHEGEERRQPVRARDRPGGLEDGQLREPRHGGERRPDAEPPARGERGGDDEPLDARVHPSRRLERRAEKSVGSRHQVVSAGGDQVEDVAVEDLALEQSLRLVEIDALVGAAEDARKRGDVAGASDEQRDREDRVEARRAVRPSTARHRETSRRAFASGPRVSLAPARGTSRLLTQTGAGAPGETGNTSTYSSVTSVSGPSRRASRLRMVASVSAVKRDFRTRRTLSAPARSCAIW